MEEFQFGIDIETKVSNKEEAIQALRTLKEQINEIEQGGAKISVDEKELEKAKVKVKALERTIEELTSHGGDFKTVFGKSLNVVQGEVDQTTKSVKKTTSALKDLNRTGQDGFLNLSKTARIATSEIEGARSQVDNLKNNLQQGIGQTIAFAGIDLIKNSVTEAFNQVERLDRVMTDISIVTGKTSEEMKSYRDYAGEAADSLGKLGREYLEAALIYEQQGGLAAIYAKDLANATVIAANVSRESTDQMSEYLTATINGFDLLRERGGEAGLYITDVMAKLGAASGSDLGEIATGLTRTANTAKDAGFEFEEAATMIATVSEVTRRTPETIGNAFRSMITNFTQLREAGGDELDEFTSKIEKAFQFAGIDGISMFDNGNLRNARDIFSDIGKQWATMDTEQQAIVSEAVAGKYQAEVFRAFMNNQERYNDLLDDAYDSAGTAAQQQMIYLDSIEAVTGRVANQWEILSSSLVSTDLFKGILEDAGTFLRVVNAQNSEIAKMTTLFSPLVGVVGQIFGTRFMADIAQRKILEETQKNTTKYLEEVKGEQEGSTEELERQIKAAKELDEIYSNLGKEAQERYQGLLEDAENLTDIIKRAEMSPDELEKMLQEKTDQFINKGQVSGLSSSVGSKMVEAEVERLRLQDESFQEETERLALLQEEHSIIHNTLQTIKSTEKANGSRSKALQEEIQNRTILGSLSEEEARKSQLIIGMLNRKQKKINDLNSAGKLDKKTEKKLNSEIQKGENELLLILEKQNAERKKALEIEKEKMKTKKGEIDNQAKENVVREHFSQPVSDEELNKAKTMLSFNEKMRNGIAKGAKTVSRVVKGFSGLSGLIGTLAPVVSNFNAISEETVSLQDGVQNALKGIGTSLLAIPHPYAKAAGGISLAVDLIIGKLDLLKSSAEKAKETNEEVVRSFLSLNEQTSGNLSTLKDLEGAYSRFEGVDAEKFLNSDKSSSEDIKTYLDMSEKIAKIRPDLVRYYDDEGRAIVNLSTKYEELIESQKEEILLSNRAMSSNSGSFLTQYSAEVEGATLEINEMSLAVAKAKKQLNEAQESGDSEKTSKALATLAEAENNLKLQKDSLEQTRDLINTNIVSPFVKGNEAISEITKSNKKLGDSLREFSSQEFSSGKITSLIESGDIKKAQNLSENLNYIFEEVKRINEESGESAATNFLNSIKDSSVLAKEALMETASGIDAVLSNIKGKGADSSYLDTLAKANAAKLESTRLTEKETEKVEELRKKQEDWLKFKKSSNSISIINKTTDKVGEKIDSGLNLPIKLSQKDAENFDDPFSREINKIEEKVGDYHKALSDIRDQFTRTSKSAEGFAENLKMIEAQESTIQTLEKIEAEIAKTGKSIGEAGSFDELFSHSPELAEELKNETLSIGDAITSVKDVNAAAKLGMVMDDEVYFAQWKANNTEQISMSDSFLGIDSSNARTLSEYRTLLEEATTGELRELAAKRVSDSAEAQGLIEKNEKGHTKSMVSFGDIWGSSQLEWYDELEVAFLLMIDKLKNGYRDFLGGLEKNVAKAQDKIEGFFGGKANNLENLEKYGGFWYNNGDDSNLAEEKLKEKQEKREAEARQRQAYIDEVLLGDKATLDGYTPTTSGSGGKGKKGQPTGAGGGTSGTQAEIDDLKLTLDLYYKLENRLKTISQEFSELKDKKDAAFGKDKLTALKEEQALLVKQASTLREYSKALEGEQGALKKTLSKKGFTFSKSGEIKNLNSLLEAMQNAANQKTGDAKKAAIERIKDAQAEAARYSNLTFDLIPDKKKAIEEAKKTFSAISRERVEYQIQLEVDRYSLQREILSLVGDFEKGYESLDEKAKLSSQTALTSLNEISLLQKALRDIRTDKNLTDSDREELIQKYQKDLMSAIKNAKSAYADLINTQKEFISETYSEIQKVAESYEKIISRSETMISNLQSLYGNNRTNQIEKLYKVQEDSLSKQNSFLENNRKQLVKYQKTLEKGSESWDEVNEKINEISDNIENNLAAQLDILQKKFENFSNGLFQQFENMFGTWGFSGATESFDKLISKNNELMSSYDKLTIIGAKIKSINDEIAKTNDPERAKVLAKYRDEELLSLMNQSEVSKDDYERALKIYEIKQKELALEERQNAKRIAQLVRDENGNMSYQYIRQETEDTQSALDELNAAKNELYEFDSQKVQESSKKIFEIIASYQNKLKELASLGLSPEEYKKEANKLLDETKSEIDRQQYIVQKWMDKVGKDGFQNIIDLFKSNVINAEQLGISGTSMNKLLGALQAGSVTYQDILLGNYQKFAETMNTSEQEAEKIVTSLSGLIMEESGNVGSALENMTDKWTSNAEENVQNLSNAYDKYLTEANRVLNTLNSTTGTFEEQLKKANKASKDVSKQIGKQTTTMIVTEKQTTKVWKEVDKLKNKLIGANGKSGLFGSLVQIKDEQNKNTQKSFKDTTLTLNSFKTKGQETDSQFKTLNTTLKNTKSELTGFKNKKVVKAINYIEDVGGAGETYAKNYREWNESINAVKQSLVGLQSELGTLPGMERFLGQKQKQQVDAISGAGIQTRNTVSAQSAPSHMDTGGYTGSWGDKSGKIAVLHEKELVLNKEDTLNILEAVKTQRAISEKLNKMKLKTFATENIINNHEKADNSITQNVQVYADFPNVSNSSEIELAFNNLLGKASTYISKK